MINQPPEQQAVAASDWAGERGKKWVENLAATERMLAPVDAPLLQALALDRDLRVADIGCGGGQTTRQIAKAIFGAGVCPQERAQDAAATLVSHSACVHGVDVSPDVIAAAKRGVSGASLGDGVSVSDAVQFYCVDAGTAASPEPSRYQRLSSRFGVMFFDEPLRAFSNLARWLVPGGRFAFAVWGPLPANPWMHCLREVVAELVELPPPQPDAPGPFRYADAERFCALLNQAGFSEVNGKPWSGKLPLGGGLSAADAATFCLSAFSVGEMLGDDSALLRAAETRLRERFEAFETEGRVLVPASVHVVTGTVA